MYDSWGKVLSIKDENQQEISAENYSHIANINPFRYRSYYYDVETELYYLNHRYYNPEIGRFISLDKILNIDESSNSCNVYKYSNNNPINMVDDDGNFALSISAAGAAGLVLLGAAIYCGTKAAAKAIGKAITNNTKPKSKSKSKEKKKKQQEQKDKYNVYVLYSPSDGNVKYVGRTKDLPQTKVRHKNNPFRAELEIHEARNDISYAESRVWEQFLIEKCNTLVKDINMPTQNQINGIAPNKMSKYKYYWDQIFLLQEENLIDCSGYPHN